MPNDESKELLPKYVSAYYYSFQLTGDDKIDAILSAVASAGKAYHHTEDWNEISKRSGLSYIETIQQAANAAARNEKSPPEEAGAKAEKVINVPVVDRGGEIGWLSPAQYSDLVDRITTALGGDEIKRGIRVSD